MMKCWISTGKSMTGKYIWTLVISEDNTLLGEMRQSTNPFDSEEEMLSAARRVAKQLNLEVEE